MGTYDLRPGTFSSLAMKLREFESELPEGERDLLATLISLAAETVQAIGEAEFQHLGFVHSVGGATLDASELNALRQGFSGVFTEAGRTNVTNSGGAQAVSVGLVVSF